MVTLTIGLVALMASMSKVFNVAVSHKLTPMIIEVTPVNEHII